MMQKKKYLFLIVILLSMAFPTFAATKQENRVNDAMDVIVDLIKIPETSIPPILLSKAYAVAVIPNVTKIGLLIGGHSGKGVIVVRQQDNSWSNPAFISLYGISLGIQLGAQSIDTILVFKSPKGVTELANGKLTLGADASITIGPIGRRTAASTDINFLSEVYSYSKTRGLFAGLSFEGSNITMDRKSNSVYYGSSSMTPELIFSSSGNIAPPSANNFVQILTSQTHQLPIAPKVDDN